MVQKQDGGHFVNHWKTEQTPTIGILNVFGIPAPTAAKSYILINPIKLSVAQMRTWDFVRDIMSQSELTTTLIVFQILKSSLL